MLVKKFLINKDPVGISYLCLSSNNMDHSPRSKRCPNSRALQITVLLQHSVKKEGIVIINFNKNRF